MYAVGVILAAVLLVVVPLVLIFYSAPTCFDGKQNQKESAVDIGGPCAALDNEDIIPHALLWSRAFLVRSGEYAATAYIENPNRSAAAINVPYRFSFYDANNILVAERNGSVSIVPGAITPVHETQIPSGNRMISRTFFEFLQIPAWTQAGNPAAALTVSNIRVSDDGVPKVSVSVHNTDVDSRTDITYVVTLFDVLGNSFASSKTIISELGGGESKHLTFTWPHSFEASAARVDVLPIMAPVVEKL